jgi:hypothetical protein
VNAGSFRFVLDKIFPRLDGVLRIGEGFGKITDFAVAIDEEDRADQPIPILPCVQGVNRCCLDTNQQSEHCHEFASVHIPGFVLFVWRFVMLEPQMTGLWREIGYGGRGIRSHSQW